MATGNSTNLVSVDYEIFGKVQGVFFRKFTAAEANKLKLVGWVMNTDKGTVKGQIQGNESSIKKMKDWLKKTGSPKSRIDRTEFKDSAIASLTFSSFEIRK